MLLTYENVTTDAIGSKSEKWTQTLLDRLVSDPTPTGRKRRLTGHFSFDFIHSTVDGELYPIECNARVHTAVILLPLTQIARCYSTDPKPGPSNILRPDQATYPRSWIHNDLITRYLPFLLSSNLNLLAYIHPSLPACASIDNGKKEIRPSEDLLEIRIDPTLVADDWLPFLVLCHVWWPTLLVTRWWQGKKWTRVSFRVVLMGW